MSLRPETCLKGERAVNNTVLPSTDVSLLFLVLIPLNPYVIKKQSKHAKFTHSELCYFFLQRERKFYFVIVKATTK